MKKWFARKNAEVPEQTGDWWKDPRLDDEGTYDYLVEELPSDTSKWERYYQQCETCGKFHKLNKVDTHYFYCYDGWDSMSYSECWKCRLKSTVHGIIRKAKKKLTPNWKAREEYKKMIKIVKKNGKLTKNVKKKLWEIASYNM